MSSYRREIRSLCHPVRVFITLIVVTLFLLVSYENFKKSSSALLKSVHQEAFLQFQSALNTFQTENSSLFGLESTESVLPLGDNLLKPEGFVDEGPLDIPTREREKEENAVVRLLRTRREQVRGVCRSGKFQDCNVEAVLTGRMFFFHHYDTSLCIVAKQSASSTWRTHLRVVNKGPPFNESIANDNIRNAFLQKPIEDIVKDVKSSSKIITVRHPLTRLVSAFRNIYNNGNVIPPHRPLIEAEYRKMVAGMNWPEKFYRFWLPALFANNMVPPDTHLEVGMRAPIDPSVLYSAEEYEHLYFVLKPKITFVHFLKFVLKTYEEGYPDYHWTPYYKGCCPCHFDYDFITKVETLSGELEYIFPKLGLPADPDTSRNQLRKRRDDTFSYFKYYQNVPMTLRTEIYKYLKPDMDLFGYELPGNFLNLI